MTALAIPGTWTFVRDLFPTPAAEDQPRTREIFCSLDVGFLTAMCYNSFILLACCVYAYKARNVPGNFNEARFYVASVYTTLLPIVAALPMYVKAERAITLAVSISLVPIISGYVTLACVYLPRLYAITFKKIGGADENRSMGEPSRGAVSSCIQTRHTFMLSRGGNKIGPSVITKKRRGLTSTTGKSSVSWNQIDEGDW